MGTGPAEHENDSAWQAYVGKAIIRFGDIEKISLLCLEHIPQDKIGDSAARLEFSRRADLLIELLEGRRTLNANLKGLVDGLKRAKVLAKTRNLIAHNPVMLDIYLNPANKNVATEHTIRSARAGAQTLTFEGLKEFADEVDELSSTMWGHFLRSSQTANSLWHTVDDSP